MTSADELAAIPAFASSLGIGLLIGLERERSPGTLAGLRTFALVALFGTLCALLSERSGNVWIIPAAALVLGLMMIAANQKHGVTGGDPGTTTTVALLLCFSLGALSWFGYSRLAVALALISTALLYFKAELHGVIQRLSRQDLMSFLQFAVITFIVLPVLPDQGYGPYGALNPYRIWLMVVLIVGGSLSGYVALRVAGPNRAIPLLGVLGGVVSSTATTLLFSRQVRGDNMSVPVAAMVILIANTVVLVRVCLIAAVVSTSVLPQLLPVLGVGVLAGIVLPLRSWWKLRGEQAPSLEMKNPTELLAALGFGLLFAAVLVASAWMNDRVGAQGVYALAAVSGLTDVDAITLSALQLLQDGGLDAIETVRVITLAYCANLLFKFLIVLSVGGRPLAMRVGLGFLMVFGALASVTLLRG
ncbi:MAG: MgtC/SapB family protein [Panacagrimonas sp.]